MGDSRFVVRAFLLFAGASTLSGIASAQPLAIQVVPESIDFGVVERGSRIVSTASVFLRPGSAEGKSFSVEPPSFATIRSAGLGAAGPLVRFEMEFSLSTGRVGVQEGTISVVLDDAPVQFPVRVEVVEPRAGSIATLLLDEPFRNGATPAGIDAWHNLVVGANLSPHYVTRREGPCLRGIDLRVYRSALINNSGAAHLSEREVDQLREFVRDGGRLILFVGPETPGDRFPIHGLVESLGLKSLGEQQVGAKRFSMVREDLPDEPMFVGVQQLRFEGHYPISVTDPDRARVVLSYPNRPDAAVVAHAKLGTGDAIAIAQHHWPVWFGEGPDRRFVGSDNAMFLENLLALRDRAE